MLGYHTLPMCMILGPFGLVWFVRRNKYVIVGSSYLIENKQNLRPSSAGILSTF